MRKLITAGTLLALAIFGIGYVIGQVRGTSSSFAAGNVPTVFDGRTFAHPNDVQGSTGAASMPKHADGTVTAVSGDSITVAADNDADNANEYGSVTTIQLTSSTQYNGISGKSAITVGSRIFAEGTVSSDGKTMTASRISVGGRGGCPHGTPPSNITPGNTTSGPSA